MASRIFQIETYYATLGPKLLVTAGIGTPAAVPAQAFIQCSGANSESFAVFFLNSDRNVAQTNSDDWPNRSEITGQRVRAEIFVPAEQYVWYLDMLRNESPVFALIDDSTPLLNRIFCNEPVGEGELFSRG